MLYKFLISLFAIIFILSFRIYDENKITKSEYLARTIYEDKILNKVLNMSLDEKIGQLFITGIDGVDSLTDEDIYIIRNLKIGGLIFFSKNIITVNQTINLINEIKDISNRDHGVPLFTSIDQEGGTVTRLPNEIIKFEKARTVGEKNDKNYAYNSAKLMGSILVNMGFNMNFAPILDVYTNPNNKVIGSRAFSSNKEIVADMAIQTINGFKDAGIISVGKHYPGHGDTDEDSHYELTILEHSYDRLREIELYPFEQAINNGIDAILVSHLLYKNIDDDIATLSNKFLSEILKKELKFKGVVITDDMIMKGITNVVSVPEASVKAIKAGVDIVLISSGYKDIIPSIEMVKDAVRNGEILQDNIDKKVYNILKMKNNYGLNNDKIFSMNVSWVNKQITDLLSKN